ncbi:hypothetical protein NDU88_004601 [Pleurodeles waltl]|uniref:Uncharacterized protein n=1 Tax=Pleurodeles waltl TaxID=8319 RepID=A0AAV7QDG9_PLEWA|nr:hypothetical protein NDU88_004601 [Pleurodeles waltl]
MISLQWNSAQDEKETWRTISLLLCSEDESGDRVNHRRGPFWCVSSLDVVAIITVAPAEPGRRHGCVRVLGWGPGRKSPARASQPEALRSVRGRWEM